MSASPSYLQSPFANETTCPSRRRSRRLRIKKRIIIPFLNAFARLSLYIHYADVGCCVGFTDIQSISYHLINFYTSTLFELAPVLCGNGRVIYGH